MIAPRINLFRYRAQIWLKQPIDFFLPQNFPCGAFHCKINMGPKGFMHTMLRPCLGECFQLHIDGQAPCGNKMIPNGTHLQYYVADFALELD